ncbi:MAG: DEAD/DEAH box helicase family protein [Prolixibacteraceae bacterium]|jgi:superfamily II DNA or RNA helicase|nr:DEAD/DEAH box helicase family protein [Prolixibacteraceae bacterium]
MDFKELLEKYQELLIENDSLRKEIKSLNIQLGVEKADITSGNTLAIKTEEKIFEKELFPVNILGSSFTTNKKSDSREKIKLFMSLFRGRDDVFAKRWENKKKETSGYSPACANEWQPGICRKPKTSCSECKHKDYLVLNEVVVDDHLRGRNNLVVGIFPMLMDETCYFLAIDFDDEGWQKDIKTLREICTTYEIPVAVERSRSGNGAHAWFFFEKPISASLARKFGSAILTSAMNIQHDITFKSYDRLFPNQDTMPKGGFGNLIALPLQKAARINDNSIFIDEHFHPYDDQWAFLASVNRFSEDDIEKLISKLCHGNELGTLKKDVEEEGKPWEKEKISLLKADFPKKVEVVKSNMLFIPKESFSQRALNQIKRLAAFKNPEFYRAQAMRMSTFNKPRIISCADETTQYLCLPRGCEEDLTELCKEFKVEVCWTDQTNGGRKIDVEFNGALRDEQPQAIDKLLEHNNGILCGTTAFGKTIAAIKLIAERKVNTLILVNKISLVSQWKDRTSEFLIINESLPSYEIYEGKKSKKNRSIIGQIGGGEQTLNGIVDIAVMQSLSREGEVKECVKDYGMVIVDECHHVSAFSFEMILKNVNAKYVYGLTATPSRKDGHHPIIIMQCGPIRYRDDAKKQAGKRPFDHFIIPRFTSFKVPAWWNKEEKDLSITELYTEIVSSEIRNQLIIDDVVQCYENGRNCIVLTERTALVDLLSKELGKQIPNVISVMGAMGAKETRETLSLITNAPKDKPLTLVSTGRYIGEGFDEPRLDTLFLAMPISWKGTLQQYAGRLHRLFEGKNEVLIYDYADIHVRMFEKMYNKRLSGYASIGYKAKGDGFATESVDIIFDNSNFLPVYSNDIVNASREILIVSPFVTKKRTFQMAKNLKIAYANNLNVIIVTRPAEEYKEKDLNTWQEAIDELKNSGVTLVPKSGIHQKFAIIDQKIIWYGSINLLSYGSAEESMMRIINPGIASELIESIKKYENESDINNQISTRFVSQDGTGPHYPPNLEPSTPAQIHCSTFQ